MDPLIEDVFPIEHGDISSQPMLVYQRIGTVSHLFRCFQKWWYPTTMGFSYYKLKKNWSVKWGDPYFLETPIFQLITAHIEKSPWIPGPMGVTLYRYQTTGSSLRGTAGSPPFRAWNSPWMVGSCCRNVSQVR